MDGPTLFILRCLSSRAHAPLVRAIDSIGSTMKLNSFSIASRAERYDAVLLFSSLSTRHGPEQFNQTESICFSGNMRLNSAVVPSFTEKSESAQRARVSRSWTSGKSRIWVSADHFQDCVYFGLFWYTQWEPSNAPWTGIRNEV